MAAEGSISCSIKFISKNDVDEVGKGINWRNVGSFLTFFVIFRTNFYFNGQPIFQLIQQNDNFLTLLFTNQAFMAVV